MKRILVIEDDKLIQEFIRLHLKECTIEFLDSFQGVEASLNANKPDLVVLDYMLLDGATGIDILKLIKIIDPSIRVIMISSSGSNISKEAIRNGADDCYYKDSRLMNYLSDVVRNL